MAIPEGKRITISHRDNPDEVVEKVNKVLKEWVACELVYNEELSGDGTVVYELRFNHL